jgi:type IV pilus assembly protein PilA
MNSTPRAAHRLSHGFTLIEVVIVMAIIAILALMTIPMFYAKIPRTQVEESLALADVAKKAVAAVYLASGTLPADNSVAKLPAPGKIVGIYVSSVAIVDGAVTMTFRAEANGKIAGKRLTWRPVVPVERSLRTVEWLCAAKKVPDGMDAGGVDVTDIPRDTMPVSCR